MRRTPLAPLTAAFLGKLEREFLGGATSREAADHLGQPIERVFAAMRADRSLFSAQERGFARRIELERGRAAQRNPFDRVH